MNAAEFSALPDVQRMSATAVAYKALGEFAPAANPQSLFGGKLLLCAGLNDTGYAYSLAMSIAGGTFLGIERRPQRLKEALRDGVCDYMVNSLDEALRVLKNEIRKKTPVAVGLLGEVASVLKEVEQRGVQPDFVVLGGASDVKMFDTLEERGALQLTGTDVPAEPILLVASAASPSTLRMFERVVLEVLRGPAAFGRKWAESSARYFRRTTPPMRSALVDETQVAAVEQGLRGQGLDGDLLLGIQGTDRSWRMESFAAAA